MNFYHISLLLLLVLSGFSGGSQHVKSSDPTVVTVCSNTSISLGVLAPILPQHEVYMSTLPLHEVFLSTLPLNEVYMSTLPLNKVFKSTLPQNGGFNIFAVNCRFSGIVETVMYFLSNIVKGLQNLSSTVVCGGEKFGWSIRIILECLQHVFEMYAWSLSESQASIQLRCELTALFSKQSFFRKHDFAIYEYKLYHSSQNLHLKIFSYNNKISTSMQTKEAHLEKSHQFHFYGGGKALIFSSDELFSYSSGNLQDQQYQFLRCIKKNDMQEPVLNNDEVLCNVPLHVLAPKLTLKCVKNISTLHDMFMPSKILLKNAQILLQDHKCQCGVFLSVFKPYKLTSNAEYQQTWYQNHKEKRAEYNKHPEYKESHKKSSKKYYLSKKDVAFPPAPPSAELFHNIVSNFCADTSPEVFEEAGCVVCGKLTPICEMEERSEIENISLLKVDGVTRKARCKDSDPVRELRGPVLAPGCNRVCSICIESLSKKKMPTLALANGLWIGEIPDELQDLTYAEQLLIARVRHNRCIVKVSSGMSKMRANAISFSNPMPKIYNVLPPPVEEMDEVLAFIYTGPCKPTKADFQRTPLLVRRLKVFKALHWLKLNHVDYYDCEISNKNLASYPEEGPPVVVDYHPSSSNKIPESTSIHDMQEEDGTTEGSCPFIVHGLTGEEFSTKTMKTIKAIALRHLTSEGKILAIGHAETPESIYSNPQLFPSMLPWLFPYGLGGIGQTEHKHKLSSMMHKRHLLMYYDKRFQKDPHFPLIAFNHEQIKESTTAGYLTAERISFHDITDRLMNINLEVLSDLTKRMTEGERVKPETEEEKLCFKLINDLDHVNGHVPGSITQKKFMRNEIWSLISYFGAPSWFITFSPADNMHPISLYFADTQETFSPELRPENE